MAGEYELRTFIEMLANGSIGTDGSLTEIQALNFRDRVVEMAHYGPAHLAVSAQHLLLRGHGVGQDPDGSYMCMTSEGTVVPGLLLR